MKYYIFLMLFLFSFSEINAQVNDSTNIVTIKTKKGKFIVGNLDVIEDDSVYVDNTTHGSQAISMSDVKYIRNGLIPPYFNETTNSSVPYYVQTAQPNGNGNHYYKNYYIFGNELNFGLSDNFNASFGFETGSLVFEGGNRVPLMQMGMKYGVSASKLFHAGISAKYYFNSEGSLLMISAPLTFGDKRTNFTVSPVYTRTDESLPLGLFTNLTLSISPKSRFIIDVVFIDDEKVPTFLYEFMFNSGFTISVGLLVVEEIAIPNLSFSIPFGQWKSKL